MLKTLSFYTFIGFLFSSNLFAATPRFNWPLFQNDLQEELNRFDGAWQTESHWRKLGCNGAYHVNAQGAISLKDIQFDVQENGSARVHASLTDGEANIRGDYKGASTICYQVEVGFNIRAYDMEFESDIYQAGTEEKPEIKIVVRSTHFGRIVLGKRVPDWVNHLVTSWVNRGLAYIWETRLGEKMNALISKKLNRYLSVN